MTEDISVIFNWFKRPHTSRMQFEALANQTIQPKNIFIWQNKGDLENFKPLDLEVANNCATSISNANFGVWSRFAYALNCRTKYVCIFDGFGVCVCCCDAGRFRLCVCGAVVVVVVDAIFGVVLVLVIVVAFGAVVFGAVVFGGGGVLTQVSLAF